MIAGSDNKSTRTIAETGAVGLVDGLVVGAAGLSNSWDGVRKHEYD